MKKIAFIFLNLFFCFSIFAQTLSNVYLNDEIYTFLEYAQTKGYCDYLIGAKPYSAKQILNAINQTLDHAEELKPEELKIINQYIEALNPKKSERKQGFLHTIADNKNEELPVSFLYDFKMDSFVSGGIYSFKEMDQYGIDISAGLDFKGDLSKFLSYKFNVNANMSTMPLYYRGDYFIGYNWYDTDYKTSAVDENNNPINETGYSVYDYLDGVMVGSGTSARELREPVRRTIKSYYNASVLPYSYSKTWDGSVYFLTNLDASGLEGWPNNLAIAPSMFGEITSDLFENRLQLKIGRYRREWAAMDDGSSLVLNKMARPFFAGEFLVSPFKFIKFSSLTGSLEYPNQAYMVNSYPTNPGMNDAEFYQNLFSINMLEFDFPFLHIDFGSSTVWPKRLEIGYLFPVINYVIAQNNYGDYDNTALFGDLKIRKPGVGSIWASIFVDEINGINNDIRTSPRAMFAGQLGGKLAIPGLNFASVSIRYTKVEPYCYTHQMVNYTPWYNGKYISESYTNNGSSLGYYLDPNSDETLVRLDFKPASGWGTAIQYQFIRHGADFGSQAVPGSSLYSELSPKNRNELKKYFLRDGAYNWMHILKFEASYTNRNKVLPINLSASVGLLYSYYTAIDDEIYKERYNYGNNKNSGADQNTSYNFINTDEYPAYFGVVLSLGVKLWSW